MQQTYSELMERFEELKRDIRSRDLHLYERWKAGGFLLDDTFVSSYPNLGQIVEQLDQEEEEEDEETEEDEDD